MWPVKLNKQVNKISWLSVTEECAEVDKRALICVLLVVICGGQLRPAGFQLKHIAPAEAVVSGLFDVWTHL